MDDSGEPARTPVPVGTQVYVKRVDDSTVAVFGQLDDLDLFGGDARQMPIGLGGTLSRWVVAAPQAQQAVDLLSGRLVRLTGESARMLQQHEAILKDGAFLGVVRNADGKFAGVLRFTKPGANLASVATALPSMAGALAMQMQLARIEKRLDAIKQDIEYLIASEQIEIEAGVSSALTVLADVYDEVQHEERFDDDQWDRVVQAELEIRELHATTRSHLRKLNRVLENDESSLSARVKALNQALRHERTAFWLRAHVHAELALTRWDLLYLARQAQQRPEQIERLVAELGDGITSRRDELVGLANRIAGYLKRGDRLDGWLDRLRLVSQKRMGDLLLELDGVCRAYEVDLERVGTQVAPEDRAVRSGGWDDMVNALRQPAAKVASTARTAFGRSGEVARRSLGKLLMLTASSERRPDAPPEDERDTPT